MYFFENLKELIRTMPKDCSQIFSLQTLFTKHNLIDPQHHLRSLKIDFLLRPQIVV